MSWVLITGAPHAFQGGAGADGALCAVHRVSAVLADGAAAVRSITQATPEACAANVSLRLTDRSS